MDSVTLQQRPKILRYDGSFTISAKGRYASSVISCAASIVGSRFDHQAELRGGLRSFGGRLRVGNCAPSMMSSQWIRWASGLVSNPNFSFATVAINFRQDL